MRDVDGGEGEVGVTAVGSGMIQQDLADSYDTVMRASGKEGELRDREAPEESKGERIEGSLGGTQDEAARVSEEAHAREAARCRVHPCVGLTSSPGRQRKAHWHAGKGPVSDEKKKEDDVPQSMFEDVKVTQGSESLGTPNVARMAERRGSLTPGSAKRRRLFPWPAGADDTHQPSSQLDASLDLLDIVAQAGVDLPVPKIRMTL